MRTPSLVIAIAVAAFAGCLPQDPNFSPNEFPTIDGGPDADVPDADPNAPDAKIDVKLVITPESRVLTITEGQSGEFKIALSERPSEPVTVNLTQPPNGVTVSPRLIIFDPATEDVKVGKPVSVIVVDDDNVVGESYTIDVSSTSPDVEAASVQVSVTDLDKVEIEVNQDRVQITEGEQGNVQVRLTAPPESGTVTVSAQVGAGDAGFIILGSALVFTQQNWNEFKAMTIGVQHDDDTFGRDVTFQLTSPGLTPKPVTVAIVDDDRQGIVVGSAPVNVIEGQRRTFTVRLRQQPAATVRVTLSEPAGVDLDVTQLDFTTGNWNVNQNVEVLAVADDNTTGATVNVRATATSLEPIDVTVNITDPDEQQILENAADPLRITEGLQGSFGVRLRFRPAATTVVNVGVTNAGLQIVTPTPNQLTFSTSNWNVNQTITVAGRVDDDLADLSGEITLNASGLETRVRVEVDDPDVQALHTTLDATNAITIQEGMTSGTRFQVWLEHQPAAATTVNIASDNPALVTVRTTDRALTFTTTNYATPQTVLLTAGTDSDQDDASTMIRVSSAAVTGTTVITATVDDTTMRDTVGDVSFQDVEAVSRSGAFGQPITVTRTMCIDRLQLITTASSGRAKMALFTDVGNKPGVSIVEASAFTLRARTTADPFSGGTIASTELAPGRYWVSALVDTSGTNIGVSTTMTRRCRQDGSANFNGPIAFGTNPPCVDGEFSLNLSATGTVGSCSAP